MQRARLVVVTAAVLGAGLIPVVASRGGGDHLLRPAFVHAQGAVTVPKAECGPNDRVETGLQGQTTLAERMSGASMQAYTCNLELVGQFEGDGASWQFASFDDCGYYVTANQPTQQRRGTVVVDASDPTDPQATAYLDDPAMLDPWESLKVNKRRKLLGATKGPGGGADDHFFSFHDLSSDCAHPKLPSVLDVADYKGHAGDFAPDGRTYYGSSLQTPPHLAAIDIDDPTNPKVIAISREFLFHDVTFSDDGTRLYGTQLGRVGGLPNGLVIVDVSDFQDRRPNPQFRVISQLLWNDGKLAQVAQPVRIKGKPYLVFVDEGGSAGIGPAAVDSACAQGLPPFGMARIIDIADETRPRIVSRLMLEIHDPANCPQTQNDNRNVVAFAYDSHYCTVDNPNNAKLVGCGHFGAGLRVFDIRDPHRPKEIAYYKPPARGNEPRPGSNFARLNPVNRGIDWSSSNVRFVRHKGDLQIWFTSQDNGFQIVRFTNGLLARTGLDKFDQDHPGNPN